mmetsp:Transcript_27007/g.49047  ORF Transcript_27007/g.49047 Transcript_27007/m.49047 type:complete len:261 (-) Transcript_27007:109-891(-)
MRGGVTTTTITITITTRTITVEGHHRGTSDNDGGRGANGRPSSIGRRWTSGSRNDRTIGAAGDAGNDRPAMGALRDSTGRVGTTADAGTEGRRGSIGRMGTEGGGGRSTTTTGALRDSTGRVGTMIAAAMEGRRDSIGRVGMAIDVAMDDGRRNLIGMLGIDTMMAMMKGQQDLIERLGAVGLEVRKERLPKMGEGHRIDSLMMTMTIGSAHRKISLKMKTYGLNWHSRLFDPDRTLEMVQGVMIHISDVAEILDSLFVV